MSLTTSQGVLLSGEDRFPDKRTKSKSMFNFLLISRLEEVAMTGQTSNLEAFVRDKFEIGVPEIRQVIQTHTCGYSYRKHTIGSRRAAMLAG